jgi:hypothetical protein
MGQPYVLLSNISDSMHIQKFWKAVLSPISSIVGFCKQITIHNLYQIISRLVAPHKFNYLSIQVSYVYVLTVRCKVINSSHIVSFYSWNVVGFTPYIAHIISYHIKSNKVTKVT